MLLGVPTDLTNLQPGLWFVWMNLWKDGVRLFFFSSALKDHLETGSSDLPGSQEDPPALISLYLSVWRGSACFWGRLWGFFLYEYYDALLLIVELLIVINSSSCPLRQWKGEGCSSWCLEGLQDRPSLDSVKHEQELSCPSAAHLPQLLSLIEELKASLLLFHLSISLSFTSCTVFLPHWVSSVPKLNPSRSHCWQFSLHCWNLLFFGFFCVDVPTTNLNDE